MSGTPIPETVACPTGELGIIRRSIESLPPGTRTSGRLLAGSMASGRPIELPWLAVKGKGSGPCLWLNSAVHGDEVNGILAALDFIRTVEPNDVSGTIVVTPVANPLGFDARRKRVPQDELDLDQTYPGRNGGLTSELLAWRLFVELRDVAEVLVSFHTMNPYFDSLPYVVYKVGGHQRVTETELLAAAAAFEPFVACRMPLQGESELPGNVTGALDYQVLQTGALAFMVELGGGSRQEHRYIQQGTRGLQTLCRQLGIIPGGKKRPDRIRRVTARRHVTCKHGGLFRQHANAGCIVSAGVPIGTVEDICGRTMEVVSFPDPVALIGIRNDPVVHSGDRVAFVGVEWDDVETSSGSP